MSQREENICIPIFLELKIYSIGEAYSFIASLKKSPPSPARPYGLRNAAWQCPKIRLCAWGWTDDRTDGQNLSPPGWMSSDGNRNSADGKGPRRNRGLIATDIYQRPILYASALIDFLMHLNKKKNFAKSSNKNFIF